MTDDRSPETVCREHYDHLDAGRYEGVLETVTDDVAYDHPGRGRLEGREELRTFLEAERPVEASTHALDELIVEAVGDESGADRIAVRGRFSGVRDDDPVEFGFADFFEFDGAGRIRRWRRFTDRHPFGGDPRD